MKLFLFVSMLGLSVAAAAQPKLVSQAIVSTTTTVVAPEEDDLQNVQNQGGGGPGAMFRNFGDGETKATTYLKNGMVKTVVKTDMGRTTIIRNNDTKLTTTLMEMMGNKNGFYISDDEQAAMRKRMDSMMQARRKDSTSTRTRPASSENQVEVHYTSETKKIAGYNCKKAWIVTTHILGIKDSNAIWYTPEIKLQNLPSTGGTMGFGAFGTNNGFDKVDGFIMAYGAKLPRGRVMNVEVTKVDTGKEVADKEFEIPKDFVVKPMKEMQNMFGGGGGGGQRIEIRQ
jgi:GLPGLI family protein